MPSSISMDNLIAQTVPLYTHPFRSLFEYDDAATHIYTQRTCRLQIPPVGTESLFRWRSGHSRVRYCRIARPCRIILYLALLRGGWRWLGVSGVELAAGASCQTFSSCNQSFSAGYNLNALPNSPSSLLNHYHPPKKQVSCRKTEIRDSSRT